MGWAVTGAFSGGQLQRYFVDPETHAARTGVFTISKKESPSLHGTFQGQRDTGYVVRNSYFSIDGQGYKTDNEGRISFALKMIVALDPGHGGPDGGAEGIGGLSESDINWKIAQACKEKLEELGATVIMTRDQNEEVSIFDRVDRAKEKGAFLVVSLHNNYSENAGVHGSEVLIPNKSSYNYALHSQGVTLANSILTNLNTLGLYNRGLVERDFPREGNKASSVYADGSTADYYGITRYARRNGMLGIIVEHGFVSNSADASKLASDAFLKSLGDADARGIFSVFKDELTIEAEGNPIMGISLAKSSQLVDTFKKSGHAYPTEYATKGAPTIDDFCELVVETARAEGVRSEVLFSQAMWETGWLSFGNLVEISQCNFAGIGATGNLGDATGGKGHTFADVRTGLLAQAQHLKAYASKKSLNTPKVDPRFDYVERGCAPTVEGLGGKWAVGQGGESYGENIVGIMRRVLDE